MPSVRTLMPRSIFLFAVISMVTPVSSSSFCLPKMPEGLMSRVTMMARRATTI